MLESVWNLLQNRCDTTHLTLGTLLHYLGKLNIKISADIQRIWKKTQINCILSAPIVIPLRIQLCMLSAFKCFIKIFWSLNTMLIVDKHCSDVWCDEFLVLRIDHKSKQVKQQWHGKFYLQPVWRSRERLAILYTENINICGWITKLETIKMQFVCIFFRICWISAENLNF